MQSVIRRADTNRDGKVEYEQFLETVSDYRLKTEQAGRLKQIGKALAYAEEFSCWPPKLFIILGNQHFAIFHRVIYAPELKHFIFIY